MSERGQSHMDEKAAVRRRVRLEATSAVDRAPSHPVMRLQRQVGNQVVARMLAQRQEDEEELQAKADPAIQRQEEEEELQMKTDPAIQRQEEEGGEEEDEELQAKHDLAIQREPEVGLEGGRPSEETVAQIQAMRGQGQPLDAGTRATMEGAFGTSLDDVRVHTGSESSALNHRLGAKAFTTGSDVFLRDDAYRPEKSEGKHLLTHELTHVVQQRNMSTSGGMNVRPAGDEYEQAADAKAAEVVSRLSEEQGEHTHS